MNKKARITGLHLISIRIWFIRALKAEKSGNTELLEVALEECWKVQKNICKSTGSEIPERPLSSSDVIPWLATHLPYSPNRPENKRDPEQPGEPEQPAGVPRKPLPYAGAGEIALPLPHKNEDINF
jgi:hypothetical protein